MATVSGQEFFGGKPGRVISTPSVFTPTEQQTGFKPLAAFQGKIGQAGKQMAQQFTQAGANIQKNVPRLFGPSEVPEKGTFSGDFTADLSKRLAALGHIGGDIASTALSIPIIAANIYIPETIKQNYRKTVDYVAGKITENPETLNTLNAVNEWIDTKASPAWKALDPDTKENIAKDSLVKALSNKSTVSPIT